MKPSRMHDEAHAIRRSHEASGAEHGHVRGLDGARDLRAARASRGRGLFGLTVALSSVVVAFGCTSSPSEPGAAPDVAQAVDPTPPAPSGGDDEPSKDGGHDKPNANDGDGGDKPNADDGPTKDAGEDPSSTDKDPSSTDPAAECEELDPCCDELGASMRATCKSLVSSNNAASCDAALTGYHNSGYCIVGSTSCATLATCCPTLPVLLQSSCTTNVDLNNSSQCDYLFGQYQTDGYCGGGPAGACTALDACCQQLSQGYKTTCQWYVTAGSQTDCATMRSTYKSSGLCN